jgi:hypothetical protein
MGFPDGEGGIMPVVEGFDYRVKDKDPSDVWQQQFQEKSRPTHRQLSL